MNIYRNIKSLGHKRRVAGRGAGRRGLCGEEEEGGRERLGEKKGVRKERRREGGRDKGKRREERKRCREEKKGAERKEQ